LKLVKFKGAPLRFPIRCERLSSLAAVGFMLGMLLYSMPATASGDLALELRELRADKIVLMLIPAGVSFRTRMDETRLPTTSCVYELGPGPSFNEVIETLGSLVTQLNRPKPDNWHAPDLRVGVIFKRAGETLRKFYFNDRGGYHDVEGFSEDRELTAKADLPDRLRAIALHQDITLVEKWHFPCPQA
jgi:hypothetical protein